MERSAEVPSSIGNASNVIDALVAIEDEETEILRHEANGDLASAKFHRAIHVNLLAALDEYSRRIDVTQQPASERIMWVANAPVTTTYRQIRDKFQGAIHDVIFQRRGAPDFSSCSGYYVVFRSACDARMSYADDGHPTVAVDNTNWWHRTFWLFFIRRTLAITALLNNVGLSSHSWRHSKFSGDRRYAVAKTFAALQSQEPHCTRDHPTTELEDQQASDHDEEEEVPCYQELTSISCSAANHTRPSSPLASQALSWKEQVERYDLDAYFEDQEEYEVWREQVRKEEGRRRRKKEKGNARGDVNTATAALRRDLAFTLYQVYGDTKFFRRVGYPRQMKFPALNACDRVTPGYFVEKCKKWLARNNSFLTDIVKFIKAADNVYPEHRHNLMRTWSQYEGTSVALDDGTVFGNPEDVLVPPPDYRVTLVEGEQGMQRLIDHLRSLTKPDAIALDTEGHGNPYVGARVDLIQICTSQKECFLLDVHRCHGLPLMRQLGEVLAHGTALRFGLNFDYADSQSFWAELDFDGNAPVHEISRMVLKASRRNP